MTLSREQEVRRQEVLAMLAYGPGCAVTAVAGLPKLGTGQPR